MCCVPFCLWHGNKNCQCCGYATYRKKKYATYIFFRDLPQKKVRDLHLFYETYIKKMYIIYIQKSGHGMHMVLVRSTGAKWVACVELSLLKADWIHLHGIFTASAAGDPPQHMTSGSPSDLQHPACPR